MYLYEVAKVKVWTYPYEDKNESKRWSLITRGNWGNTTIRGVQGFDSFDEAVQCLKRVAPATPLLSLDGKSPDPIPTWDEFQNWLSDKGLAKLPY